MYRWIAYMALIAMPATGIAALDESEVRQFFDAAFEIQRQEHELAGAIVSVVQDGDVLFKKGYGFADIAARTPADADRSLFRIASITKTFVWTAVMQLVERGELDLDTDVNAYLDFTIPETFAEPITLSHLMTHTPGFEERGAGGFRKNVEDLIPLGEYLATHMPQRVRPPGQYLSYSNYGTALAGYIVQRVSGMPWEQFIEENIFEPLSMSNTNVRTPVRADLRLKLATGYQFSSGNFVAQPYWQELEAPAGIISTTAADMTHFMLAHLQDGTFEGVTILQPETVQRMRRVLHRHHPLAGPMLHGFFQTERNDIVRFGHGGDVNQFHSQMQLVPEHQLGIFVSFNSDPGSAARSNLVSAFFNRFFPVAPPEPIEASAELAATLDQYAGSYTTLRRNHSSFEKIAVLVNDLTVGAGDGELTIASQGRVSRWIPVEPDVFRAKYGHNHLVAKRGDGGDVTHLVVDQSAFERLTFWDRPQTHIAFLSVIGTIALLGFLSTGYRILSRGPVLQLNPLHNAFAFFATIAILFFLWGLSEGMSNTDAFVFGVPAFVERLFALALVLVVLALIGVYFSVMQWVNGDGTLWMRIRYSAFALVGLVFAWELNYWNLLSYFWT